LDVNSSTTHKLTKEKPVLAHNSAYKLEPKLFITPTPERRGEGGLRTKKLFKTSYPNKPLISIVTVVYNGKRHLEQTINSVLDQSYDNVEYIIIDGASTDGTLDIIKKFNDQIDYWISEPDNGIFDAMNKGLKCASGNFIGFINADDTYKHNILDTVIDNILAHPKVHFFYGDVDVVNNQQEYLHLFSGASQGEKLGMYIPHQSSFINLDVHRQYPFDITYKIAADRVLFAQLFKNKFEGYYMGISVANFMEGGASADQQLTLKERKRYILQCFGWRYIMKSNIKKFIYNFGIRTKIKKVFSKIKKFV